MEKELIRQIKAGDTEAYGQLVRAYQKQVYALCLRMVGDPGEAEDLTQEAFVKSWQGLEYYRYEAAFSTWLYRLTTNLCLDHLRRRKRQAALTAAWDEEAEYRDTALTPEEACLRREAYGELDAAMAALSPEDRALLVLRVVRELSYEEIAADLNIPVGTVKSRLSRARMRLKESFRGNGNDSRFPSSNP